MPPIWLAVDSEAFASGIGRNSIALRNYHNETQITQETIRTAKPAAVLIPIVENVGELSLLFTRRHHAISYPEMVCFPGGRRDPDDANASSTALREAHEEIDLQPSKVRILGRLGDYVTHTGYCITPVVGVVQPPLELTPSPHEVTEILEIPFGVVTDSRSYQLWQPDPQSPNAYYSLTHDDTVLTGPTVCIAMGLYESLCKTHSPVTGEIADRVRV